MNIIDEKIERNKLQNKKINKAKANEKKNSIRKKKINKKSPANVKTNAINIDYTSERASEQCWQD